MIDLGTIRPGSTVRIPWGSYDGATGASEAASNYADADILVYKDGSTTETAGGSCGGTATTSFDSASLTGINLITINTADNTTAGWWAAGSEYLVMVGPVTVDTQTVYFPAARFRLGYPNASHNTTIATLASQTSFTLTEGPAEDDALNGCVALIHDVASAVQCGYAVVQDYTGASKTVTLAAGVTFVAAATDNIAFFPPANVSYFGGTAGTFASGRPEVNTTHFAGTAYATALAAEVDAVWDEATAGHVTAGSTGVALTDILTDTGTTLDGRIPAALVGGRMDANVGAISSDATAADNAEAFFDGTGYAGTNNVIPSVTTVTGNVNGSVGSVTGAVGSVTGAVGSVTGAVGSVTGNVGGNVTGSVGSVVGAVGSVTGNVGGNVTGSVGSVAAGGIAAASFAAGAINAAAIADAAIDNATFAADVGSTAIATNVIGIAAAKGVANELNVTTYAEPGQEAPAATNTLVKKIGYLFKFLRNKITQDATTLQVYDDAGTTVDQKATVSDSGTTYTRGEIGSGP